MSAATRMPRGGPIRPRHPTFDLEEALAGDWNGGDPFRTAFFNAMSLSFPSGERFFIDAVREHEDEIRDPALREAVRGFIGQEAVHRRIHAAYNETFCRRRGYDLDELEGPFLEGVEWSEENLSPLARLAATVALEHITAILAAALLDAPVPGSSRGPTRGSRSSGGGTPSRRPSTSLRRVRRLRPGVRGLPEAAAATLKWRDGELPPRQLPGRPDHASPRRARAMVFAGGMWYLFGWPGILRRLVPEWTTFLRPDSTRRRKATRPSSTGGIPTPRWYRSPPIRPAAAGRSRVARRPLRPGGAFPHPATQSTPQPNRSLRLRVR